MATTVPARGVAILLNATTIAGGNGGYGGAGGGQNAYSGGGGAGGYGAVITGTLQSTNNGLILGGRGGEGGHNPFGTDGEGGDGGYGILFEAAGASFFNSGTITAGDGGYGADTLAAAGGVGASFAAAFTLQNAAAGSISGGAGGAGSANHDAYGGGPGGAGVAGSNGTIDNAGKISGGAGGMANTGGFFGASTTGGNGGAGIQGDTLSIGNDGTIQGGGGGSGQAYARGGAGGDGILGSGSTITNDDAITGGNGGSTGLGRPAAGGDGIAGGGLTIVNAGTITGGMGNQSGQASGQAYAIDSTGGTSTVTFDNATSGLSGDIYDGALLIFKQPTDTTLASGIFGDTVVKQGAGTLTLSSASSTYSGGTYLQGGGLELAAAETVANGAVTSGPLGTGAMTFGGSAASPATLTLDQVAQPASGGTFGTTLADFGIGDTLDLKDFVFNPLDATFEATNGTLTVTNGIQSESFTLTSSAPSYMAQSDGSGGTRIQAIICFAAGTLIRTVRGEVPVERLAVGDVVVTASGAARPIKWLGHRTIDCRRHARPHEAQPVRIAAHAFGDNRPSRDLVVSPGHSICVDIVGEVLIPVGALANGTTIAQLDVERVTYWHVELDGHDLLLAENLSCESYIDCGTRAFFAEADVVALDASPDARVHTTDDYCRPFKPEGRLVEVIRDRLRVRAEALGQRPMVATRVDLMKAE